MIDIFNIFSALRNRLCAVSMVRLEGGKVHIQITSRAQHCKQRKYIELRENIKVDGPLMSQWLMPVSDPSATPSSWRSSSLKSSWWSFASLQNTGDIAAGGGSGLGLAGQHKLRHSFRYNTSNSQINNGHYNLGYGYHNPAFSTSINHLSGTALSVTKYNQKNIKRSVISSQWKLEYLSCHCVMSSHVLMS